uniref:Ycf89 n=1 Tax=Thalassionema frauenfeldii TaxID=186022 RepID=UPI001EDF5261|nr:Ycf89 [Thalassionema frauenfeldii]YP_010277066.1 Ycf89 [Thalassionema frauenfeldii]UHY40528.1 Ycf89 [Thalassionema frauenfeldii]UHY40589.1 Ycf89 [Thalassionema frauenfeldii]UHY40916.1 Ycf89 [Thalassionema frauenfeldii]UHY40977.1 Ycf89 [Thalassionema frauenfeldii]
MLNKEDLLELRGRYFQFVSQCFQTFAKPFGFPNIRGMQLLPPDEKYWWVREADPTANLPLRRLRFPPASQPQNYFEVLFGDRAKPASTPRIYYENATDGFYSFFVENYKNLTFLPDWFSEFLQINLNIYNDLSLVELGREALFVVVLTYYYVMVVRVAIGWFVSINPYVFPLSYLVMFVDWIDEVITSITPVLGGFGIGTPLLFMYVGKFADYVNNLVFTMPYLPSEGQFQKAFISGQVKNILAFKDLPYLWYTRTIPNELREFWYLERKDIYNYMKKAYGKIDLQIDPDPIVRKEFNEFLLNRTLVEQKPKLNIITYDYSELMQKIMKFLIVLFQRFINIIEHLFGNFNSYFDKIISYKNHDLLISQFFINCKLLLIELLSKYNINILDIENFNHNNLLYSNSKQFLIATIHSFNF